MVTQNGITGSKTVGTSAVALAGSEVLNLGVVKVRGDISNTGIVYVGYSDEITADSAEATDGYPLYGDNETLIYVRDPSLIYLISDTADQKVYFNGQ